MRDIYLYKYATLDHIVKTANKIYVTRYRRCNTHRSSYKPNESKKLDDTAKAQVRSCENAR